jgi:hypothetical protein
MLSTGSEKDAYSRQSAWRKTRRVLHSPNSDTMIQFAVSVISFGGQYLCIVSAAPERETHSTTHKLSIKPTNPAHQTHCANQHPPMPTNVMNMTRRSF